MKFTEIGHFSCIRGSMLIALTVATLGLSAPSCATAATPATPETSNSIPVADFFRSPQFTSATLSPDGKHVAMLTSDQNQRLTLSVLNVETLKPKLLARYVDADVGRFHWVNNKRIVYSLGDSRRAAGETHSGSGLFAVDIHSGQQRQLIDRNFSNEHRVTRMLTPYHSFFSTIEESETDDIYIQEYLPSSGGSHPGSYNLLRLNTTTGITRQIERPGRVTSWRLDNHGLPRIATTFDKGVSTTWLRDDKNNQWNKLFEFAERNANTIFPRGFGPDGQFYVTARQGKDLAALYRYDLEKNRIEAEPVVALDGYDFDGSLIFNRSSKKILGVRYTTDAPGTLWLDESYKQIQKKLDELIPGKVNLIAIRTESDSDTVMVSSFSDTDPGSFALYNHKTSQFIPLGQVMPWIKPEQMAYKDFVKYKARDGLTIPAYLTLPKGKKKNLPVVVLVHGGPFVPSDSWDWNPQVQFLASRGYAVLQPEFRGTTGLGYQHERLGYKQWGLAMQDDVTDGTKWLIEQGIADPKRICIAGASYGGYATLLGLIREPDLYQCGISWVGVTDLGLLHTLPQSDFNDDTVRYYLPQQVADLKQDAAQIKATSAIENASKIKAPLILAYGGSDVRVPKEHGERLKAAMNGANPGLEWIVYPEEAHGWGGLKNNVDFWTRVEKLLARTTWKQEAKPEAGSTGATPATSVK